MFLQISWKFPSLPPQTTPPGPFYFSSCLLGVFQKQQMNRTPGHKLGQVAQRSASVLRHDPWWWTMARIPHSPRHFHSQWVDFSSYNTCKATLHFSVLPQWFFCDQSSTCLLLHDYNVIGTHGSALHLLPFTPSSHLPIRLSVHASVWTSVCLSVQVTVSLSTSLYICITDCLSLCLDLLSDWLPIHLSVSDCLPLWPYRSIGLSVWLVICLCDYLSIWLYLSKCLSFYLTVFD